MSGDAVRVGKPLGGGRGVVDAGGRAAGDGLGEQLRHAPGEPGVAGGPVVGAGGGELSGDLLGGQRFGCKDLDGRDPHCDNSRQTDSSLFCNPLSSFITKAMKMVHPIKNGKRLNKTNGWIDWSTDGCSDVEYKAKTRFRNPETFHGAKIWKACWRHDFGYRNYKKQGRFSEYNRGQIDNNFRADMYGLCKSLKHLWGTACRRMADAYYAAVRNFG